ncbi:MAG: RNA polymerase sigma factor [Planctomycetes bacterium]|nr:RNA polymerase sigma factor [Planctomycetota bacterium]
MARQDREAWLELAARALAGDRSAQGSVLESLRPRLQRFVLRHTGNEDLAEEVTQESLVKIYEKMTAVREPAALEGWAYQLTSNVLRDHFRHGKRDEQGREKLQMLGWSGTLSLEDPAEIAEKAELARLVGWAMSCLDDKHRVVLEMREYENREHREIADMLGIPEGTVWSRLSIARRKLRNILRNTDEAV